MKRNLPKRSVLFTEPQLKWLQETAKRLGITVSDLNRRIIDTYRGADPKQKEEEPEE